MSICDPHKCSWHFPNRVFIHKLGNTAIYIILRSSEKHTTQIKGMKRIQHYPLHSLAIIGSIWSGSWRSSSGNSASLSLIFLIMISARVCWGGAFLTKNNSNNFSSSSLTSLDNYHHRTFHQNHQCHLPPLKSLYSPLPHSRRKQRKTQRWWSSSRRSLHQQSLFAGQGLPSWSWS